MRDAWIVLAGACTLGCYVCLSGWMFRRPSSMIAMGVAIIAFGGSLDMIAEAATTKEATVSDPFFVHVTKVVGIVLYGLGTGMLASAFTTKLQFLHVGDIQRLDGQLEGKGALVNYLENELKTYEKHRLTMDEQTYEHGTRWLTGKLIDTRIEVEELQEKLTHLRQYR